MWEEDTLRNHTFMNLDQCPFCEKGKISSSMKETEIPYGIGEDRADIKCTVLVHECNLCNEAFTDFRAEEVIDEAVKKHLEKKENHE